MILVVEDEPGILDFIERGLRQDGFELDTATDGRTGLEKALDPITDLVILDLMLPELSGQEILDRLGRARPELPVIVLTALGGVSDRVAGLDGGAVDYIVKPFDIEELGARVRAQLRLSSRGATTSLASGDIQVDLITRIVSVAGSEVRLATTEFELLTHLMRNQGRVLGREQILRAVWGYQHDPGSNVVDVYIGYLRRKLGEAGAATAITTVRSLGYRFDGAAP